MNLIEKQTKNKAKHSKKVLVAEIKKKALRHVMLKRDLIDTMAGLKGLDPKKMGKKISSIIKKASIIEGEIKSLMMFYTLVYEEQFDLHPIVDKALQKHIPAFLGKKKSKKKPKGEGKGEEVKEPGITMHADSDLPPDVQKALKKLQEKLKHSKGFKNSHISCQKMSIQEFGKTLGMDSKDYGSIEEFDRAIQAKLESQGNLDFIATSKNVEESIKDAIIEKAEQEATSPEAIIKDGSKLN
jgi:hypothetical protein